MSNKPVVLLDMDGCLVNLWDSIGDQMRRNGFIPVAEKDLTEWDIRKVYPDHVLQSEAHRALNTFNTFFKAQPREGAVEAAHKLASVYEVFIVTTPWAGNPYCVTEKINWVVQHLGVEWVRRMIVTYDKTLVRGDILIDDKPEITGAMVPTWKHILFHQGYNATVNLPRIVAWQQAHDVVEYLLKQSHMEYGFTDWSKPDPATKWVHKRKPGDPVAKWE